MSYIESLRVFVRVMDLGSITAGGRDLRLTPAVASKRLKELEKHLGVRLLNRTTRSMAPTDVGQVFYEEAKQILQALETAEARVSSFSDAPRGAVRVTAPLGLGRKVIAPLVPEFCDLYPYVDIRMRLSDRKVDIMAEGLDIEFFAGVPSDSTMKMRKFSDCDRVLCAAPDYLSRFGVPEKPDDLLHGRHNCLLLRFPRSPEYFWTLQTKAGPRKLEVQGRYDADHGDVLTDWALAGRGIVNKPRFDVADHLQNGRLVEILPDTPPTPIMFGCLYPHKNFQDLKVRLFVDFIAKRSKEYFAGL